MVMLVYRVQAAIAGRAPDAGAAAPAEADAPPRWRRLLRRRLPSPLASVTLVAAVFFALGSVGTPLVGQSVYAATDELSTYSPYYDAGLAGTEAEDTILGHTCRDGVPGGAP